MKQERKMIGLVIMALLLVCAIIPSVSAVGAPTVTSSAATLIQSKLATLNGNLVSYGATDVYALVNFSWGVAGTYTTVTNRVNKTSLGAFTQALTGLTAGTAYSYRAHANNSAAVPLGSNGVNRYFLTKPLNATGLWATASDDDILLNWTLGTGGDGCYIEYQLSNDTSWSKGDGTAIGTGTIAVGMTNGTTFTQTAVSPNTVYYYKAWEYAYQNASYYSNATTGFCPYADNPRYDSVASNFASQQHGGGGTTTLYTVEFQVRDESNLPVTGATITFSGIQVVTSPLGEASFTTSPGTYTLSVQKTGYYSLSEPFLVNGEEVYAVTMSKTTTTPSGTTTTIPGTPGSTTGESPIPGFEIVVLIGAIAVSMIVLRKRR